MYKRGGIEHWSECARAFRHANEFCYSQRTAAYVAQVLQRKVCFHWLMVRSLHDGDRVVLRQVSLKGTSWVHFVKDSVCPRGCSFLQWIHKHYHKCANFRLDSRGSCKTKLNGIVPQSRIQSSRNGWVWWIEAIYTTHSTPGVGATLSCMQVQSFQNNSSGKNYKAWHTVFNRMKRE